jgi:hypothetical protein
MTSALRGLRKSEEEALADYISRLAHIEPLSDPERSPRR